MADQLDSSIISVSVLDDFSDTLNELSSQLLQVDAQAENVDPIQIDANVAKALAELEAVEQKLDQIDRKHVDAHVDIDRDPLQERVAGIAARGRGRVGELAMLGRGPGALGGGPLDTDNIDIDVDRRAGRAIASSVAGGGGQLGQTVAEAMDMPDLFGGRRGRGPGRRFLREFLDMELHMSGFMTTLASLIPLMAVFIGALPAAIAGLVALAGAAVAAASALLAPVALGVGGMVFADGQLNVAELQDEIRRTLDTFLKSFTPVMEALQPMVEGLFDQFRFLIRDLSRRSNVLIQLTDEVAGAFGFLSETIGPALEDLIRFGEAAMPTMQLLIGGLASFDWFDIFASLLIQTLPLLDMFATHIVSLTPAIIQLSIGFFTVASAILGFLGFIGQIIDIIPMAGETLGFLIAALLTALSVTALYSAILNSATTGLIRLAAVGIHSAVNSLLAYVSTAQLGIWATTGLAIAATTLLGVLTFGLAPVLGGIVGSFIGLGDGVAKATDELGRFEKQSARIGGPDLGGGPPGYGRSRPSYGSGGNTTVVAPDQETGNAVAANMRWESGWSPASPESDVNNRQHSE